MTDRPTELDPAVSAEQITETGREGSLASLADRLAADLSGVARLRRPAPILNYLNQYEKQLAEVHQHFQEASVEELTLTYASEWVLDNYYIIRQAIQQIREDLPPGYLSTLPSLTQSRYQGYPRVYVLARAFLEAEQLQVDVVNLETFLNQMQEQIALTMGELWAIPIFLRFVQLEAMTHALVRLLKPMQEIGLPTPDIDLDLSNNDTVANAVVGLRAIANQDWKEFFETVSLVDRTLRLDPVGVYEQMDFESRDLYRKAIEKLSFRSGIPEKEIAATTLSLAAHAHRNQPTKPLAHALEHDTRSSHVGYYLIDAGRADLEREIGYRPTRLERVQRWWADRSQVAYFSLIGLFSFFFLLIFTLYAITQTANIWLILLTPLLLLVPALTVSTELINWVLTLLFPPQVLPKLEFERAIPETFHTVIAIPTLLTSVEEVESLTQQLELHYLRNREAGISFALLSDFADAGAETLPEDEALITLAMQRVEKLNARYASARDGRPLFYLFHRRRVWNPSEGCWMGWERKRGKLHEFNRLLRGHTDHTFVYSVGDPANLRSVRYVITLDADTLLPIGAASRLIGAMAHPLNRPIFAPGKPQVIAGYTVMQPRVEISPATANRSWFTRIFSGDTGLDLYTLAVSDVYQDVFGEGSYVGKGIYDVDAFERALEGKIPENRLLSHDLFEGLLGRAGLVTDISLVEDYPPNYFVFARRMHRWIRGDWQLLPWLLSPGKAGGQLSDLDRWKLFDNLRRSLLAPSLTLLLFCGWLFLPGRPLVWMGVAALTLSIPLLTDLVMGVTQMLEGKVTPASTRSLRLTFLRWLLSVVLMPFESLNAVDAIAVTLYRLYVSRRKLLEWTTAAHTALMVDQERAVRFAWKEMGMAALIVLAVATLIALLNPPALPVAAPLFVVWLLSPQLVVFLNQPVRELVETLSKEETQKLRNYARRTWAFFEQFVGPEDHWLPPDHFQESPVGMVAHRTSPTNIGLMLTATIGAYEMGYLDLLTLVFRLSATFETLSKLERHRGHFLNWLDTQTLQPLNPRYVSTVDSGNLAACLIVTAQWLQTLHETRVVRWEHWEGYFDSLSLLDETLAPLERTAVSRLVKQIRAQIGEIRAKIEQAQHRPEQWYRLFVETSGPQQEELDRRLSELVSSKEKGLDRDDLRQIMLVSSQIKQQLNGFRRSMLELTPWVALFDSIPAAFRQGDFSTEIERLRESLPADPALGQIGACTETARQILAELKEKAQAAGVTGEPIIWLDEFSTQLLEASGKAAVLLTGYANIAQQAQQYVDEMDFRFLYDPLRRVFHIGYNLDAALLDHNYYDLLASEARITSLIAIAKGDVPPEHWLHLNRPVTLVENLRVLLSWSATMFEYLMPPLFLRTYPGTLLNESALGAVLHQIDYGRSKGVPWGISESGFYRFDSNQNYQYRAFGVPGLGFKRGLSDDLVIAPYASFMAVGYRPKSVLRNADHLIEYNMLGLYGFYEAIDFTDNRLSVGQQYGIVYSYMAHHQGMILLALYNYLKDGLFVEHMHADPRIKSVELLLQEQIPFAAPLQNPESENVAGTQRLITEPVEIEPWIVPTYTSSPQIHLLSNGSFNTLISNSGSGYIRWNDVDLTRWRPDPVLDHCGNWIFVRDLDSKSGKHNLWSISKQPVTDVDPDPSVTYHSHMAVFRRTVNDITTTMEVTVSPDDPVEIRRVHVANSADKPRRLQLTSYGEVILTAQANDRRHPAFNKLFIQSEYLPDHNLLLFRRRPRSANEKPVFLGHMLVLENGHELTRIYETDRYKFLGRGRSVSQPAALLGAGSLSGSTGSTLDPIYALGQEIFLDPHESVQMAWLTIAANSREDLVEIAARYQSWPLIERAFHLAHITSEAQLRKQDIDSQKLSHILQLLSALLFPISALRADAETIARNQLGQSGLWPFGISGDYPILLVRVRDPQQLELVRELLQAHRYWRDRGILIDLVILNDQRTDYGAELQGLLYRLVTRTNSDNWLHQRGGIFILYTDQMNEQARTLLLTAARVVLNGDQGSLAQQLPGYTVSVPHLPAFVPSRILTEPLEPTPALPPLEELQFFNGYGGFTQDGREYVIDLPPGRQTPLPWTNVIGYPQFGFLVTESGSSTTWALNSGENRLTPWSNDPVTDPTGEALYLRDEETGEFWTPTPRPSGGRSTYRVRHGAGYTSFEHNSHGLRQQLRLYADPEDPVKIIRLRVENTWNRPRRLTATQYVEWVLGTIREPVQQYIIPEYLHDREALLATNPYSPEFNQRVAFLAAGTKVHGMTADRLEFLGRNGSLQSPAGMYRIGLERRISPGEYPCAVLQVHLDLNPGEAQEVYFVLGQGADRADALALIEKYQSDGQIDETWQRVQTFWDRLLGAICVETPDKAVNLLLNRWLLYQTLSCRIWGRTAFYQSSGAYGFRDQLQDVLAVLPIAPEIARQQILTAARHQFEAGDVLHWWHPPTGRGVRTRISDDLLWLPYVTAEYVRTTGDVSILAEEAPFRQGPPLEDHEEERYGEYPLTETTSTLLDHCERAVQRGSTRGPHGLPLIGTGDWNDGMNRVGAEGRGESVWMAWFLHEVLNRFAWLCDLTSRSDSAEGYRQQAALLREAVEAHAWDGAWYLRAFYDDGYPLGSQHNRECQIDSIAQSWAVISRAGSPDRARRAVNSALERLVRPEDRLLLLFTPPFDQTPHDPGYIKGYAPGIRENGGQYTHGVTWLVWAFADLEEGDTAGKLYRLLNPIYQADTKEKADVYKVEPYVVAADIYSTPPHVRRGGWTWYTGSSGWMYRLGIEALLGFKREGDYLTFKPVIPSDWDQAHIQYKVGDTVYKIHILNPHRVECGVSSLRLDGVEQNDHRIPFYKDGKVHEVEIVMGKVSQPELQG